MAPPHRIGDYLKESAETTGKAGVYDVPMFFERKRAEEKIRNTLQEKEILLKEIHHRVKNNLQIISSLLNLQSSFIDHPGIAQLIEDIQGRIKTMALVHEKLYRTNPDAVDLSDYLSSVADSAAQTLVKPGINIAFDLQKPAEPVSLKIDKAIPIGLLVHEIITNAVKYAFHGRAAGTIHIAVTCGEPGEIGLYIADDGIGAPAMESGPASEATFGVELIRLLTDQLDGTMELHTDKGFRYQFRFPKTS